MGNNSVVDRSGYQSLIRMRGTPIMHQISAVYDNRFKVERGSMNTISFTMTLFGCIQVKSKYGNLHLTSLQ